MDFYDSFDSTNYSRHPKSFQLYVDDRTDDFTHDRVVSVGLLSKMCGLNQPFPFYFTLFASNPQKQKGNSLRKPIYSPCRVTPTAEVKDGQSLGYIELALKVDKETKKKPIIRELKVVFKDNGSMSPVLESNKEGVSKWLINEPELSLLVNSPIDYIMLAVDEDGLAVYSFESRVDEYRHLPKDVAKVFQDFIGIAFETLRKETGWEPKSPSPLVPHGGSHEYETLAEYCYVYLMHDTSNGFYKIGISNNPEYRESTLQGEKPTIEKICDKKYPSRKIASAIESSLHKVFESKRIRGEWFRLDSIDVWQISETLK